jgi:hypothetical protein
MRKTQKQEFLNKFQHTTHHRILLILCQSQIHNRIDGFDYSD